MRVPCHKQVQYMHDIHVILSRGGSTASNNNMHDIPSPHIHIHLFHHHINIIAYLK